jgi:hypothetical protein
MFGESEARLAPYNARQNGNARKGSAMLWALVVVLLILWAAGLAASYTLGGLLHLLLIAALVVLVVQLVQGRASV